MSADNSPANTVARSQRVDVRNPVSMLPAMEAMRALPAESRAAMRQVLKDIAVDARAKAEKCWRTHKAPMAAYWKAVAVYAGHTARAIR
jgi:hypothetical protein